MAQLGVSHLLPFGLARFGYCKHSWSCEQDSCCCPQHSPAQGQRVPRALLEAKPAAAADVAFGHHQNLRLQNPSASVTGKPDSQLLPFFSVTAGGGRSSRETPFRQGKCKENVSLISEKTKPP